MNRCICFSPVGTSRCIGPRTVPVRSGLSGPQTADFSRPLLTSDALRTGTVRGPFARAATTLNRYERGGVVAAQQPLPLLNTYQASRLPPLPKPATVNVPESPPKQQTLRLHNLDSVNHSAVSTIHCKLRHDVNCDDSAGGRDVRCLHD